MDGSADEILVDRVCVIVFADLVGKSPAMAETPGLRDYIKMQALNLCSAGQRDIEQLARYAQAQAVEWLHLR